MRECQKCGRVPCICKSTPDTAERGAVLTVSITQDSKSGAIELHMSDNMTRMQVRALLTGALALIDSDMIAESLAGKLRAMAEEEAKKKILSL